MKISAGNIPMYFQFYLQLKNDILLKEIPPGSSLPTIDELHERHGVSHGTVRKTMELLEKEGLIIRKRGLGTSVSENVDLFMWSPSSSKKELLNDLKSANIQPISDEWVRAPRRIQTIFSDQKKEVYKDGRIFKIRHVSSQIEDSRRRNLADIYIPAWIMDEISPDPNIKKPILEILWQLKGLKSVRIIQIVRPWLCDKECGEMLGLVEGTPIFQRSWTVRDGNKQVLICIESFSTVNALSREINIKINSNDKDLI